MIPQPGDVLEVTRAASVQFVEPLRFRVIRVHDWKTYVGWIWLDGYELDRSGDAVERRSIFVQLAGLRPVPDGPTRPELELSVKCGVARPSKSLFPLSGCVP